MVTSRGASPAPAIVTSQRGEASTEDYRQALVHYRALVAELLGTDPVLDRQRLCAREHRR